MSASSVIIPSNTAATDWWVVKLRLAVSLILIVSVPLMLVGCGSETDSESADSGGDSTQTTEVVNLPEAEPEPEPEPIDWTPPAGDSYEDSLIAYDQARDSKIGEHPGYAFAGDIWERMAAEGHPPSQYHLGLLHFFGNGSREFNHNLTGDYIRQSAASGYPLAYAFMALQNENGDGALFLKGDEVALSNWQAAADGGHCGAIKRLKKAYTDGELGVTADPARVAELEAAEPDCKAR